MCFIKEKDVLLKCVVNNNYKEQDIPLVYTVCSRNVIPYKIIFR